jgi:DNA polymerase (family 10)
MTDASDKRKYMPDKIRRPREALQILVDELEIGGLTVAGSWRRGKETVGDLDILVPYDREMRADIATLCKWGYHEIRGGNMKSEGTVPLDDESLLLLNLWQVPTPQSWAGLLLFATGPNDLNISMRARAKGKSLTLSQYGLFQRFDPGDAPFQLDTGKDEREIFDLLGITYLTPEERERWRDYTGRKPAETTKVQVPSSDGKNTYTVTLKDGKGWDCECLGFGYRGKCRHLTIAEETHGKVD